MIIWDQIIDWLIVPGVVALICGFGGIWMSRGHVFLSAKQRAILQEPWPL